MSDQIYSSIKKMGVEKCTSCYGKKICYVWRYEGPAVGRVQYWIPCEKCCIERPTGMTGYEKIDEALAWFKDSTPPTEPFYLWPRLKVHWPDRYWEQLKDELKRPDLARIYVTYEEIIRLFTIFAFEEFTA